MTRILFFALLAVALITPARGFALGQEKSEQSGVVLEALAEVEVEATTAEGKKEITRVEAALVTPGDEVIYTIRYANEGAEPAEDVVITNPVPEHMACRALDDAPVNVAITLSVDGGETFDVLEKLTVLDEEGETRLADIADATHVRWTLGKSLPPGGSGQVSFRAVLQ